MTTPALPDAAVMDGSCDHDWEWCDGRCLDGDCNWRICRRCGQTEGGGGP